MEPTPRPRVKVCCIASVDEARAAVRAGASAVGLVSEMPSGPGVVDEGTIAEVARAVPPGVSAFLLTSRTDAASIVAQVRRTGVTVVQLCDRVGERELRALREALPATKLVPVVHVTGPESLDEALALAPFGDALLLDSGRPGAAVKELGGTGRRHDWALSRRIREAVPVPVFLAGGLNPGNVAEAVETVAPFGLDLCTGVRTGGRLDVEKLTAFFAHLSERHPDPRSDT